MKKSLIPLTALMLSVLTVQGCSSSYYEDEMQLEQISVQIPGLSSYSAEVGKKANYGYTVLGDGSDVKSIEMFTFSKYCSTYSIDFVFQSNDSFHFIVSGSFSIQYKKL